MMIALYLGVKGKLNNDVIDLYKELGSAKCEARNFLKDLESGISFPLLLWDRLFDMVDISNGTCPEYFCGDFIKSEFPDLHKVMI